MILSMPLLNLVSILSLLQRSIDADRNADAGPLPGTTYIEKDSPSTMDNLIGAVTPPPTPQPVIHDSVIHEPYFMELIDGSQHHMYSKFIVYLHTSESK
jgi:hypothetical protein